MVMQTAVIGPDAERRTVTPADRLAGDGHHWSRGEGSALLQSHLDGAERGNPVEVQPETAGKPTVRKAQPLSGNRMTQEAKAGRSKGQGKDGSRQYSCSVAAITRRIRALVVRLERALTWVG